MSGGPELDFGAAGELDIAAAGGLDCGSGLLSRWLEHKPKKHRERNE